MQLNAFIIKRCTILLLSISLNSLLNSMIEPKSTHLKGNLTTLHQLAARSSAPITPSQHQLCQQSKTTTSPLTALLLPRLNQQRCTHNIPSQIPKITLTTHGKASSIENTIKKHRSEDRFVTIDDHEGKYAFYAVFDGHGNELVAETLKENLHNYIFRNIEQEGLTTENLKHWMLNCFANVDSATYKNLLDGGSCAVIAIVAKTNKKLFIINIGDSRAILCRPNCRPSVHQLSTDHKVSNPLERERIEQAGGLICNGFASATLAMSRSLGDYNAKEYSHNCASETRLFTAMSEPEVKVRNLQLYDKYLILASDGLWDVLSNENAAHIVDTTISISDSCTLAAQELTKSARDLHSSDDITAIVVKFEYPQK